MVFGVKFQYQYQYQVFILVLEGHLVLVRIGFNLLVFLWYRHWYRH